MEPVEIKRNSLGYKLAYMPVVKRGGETLLSAPKSSCAYYTNIIFNSLLLVLITPLFFCLPVTIQIITDLLFGLSSVDINLVLNHIRGYNLALYAIAVGYTVIPAAVIMVFTLGVVAMGLTLLIVGTIHKCNIRFVREVSDYFKGICKPIKIVD